MDMPITYMKLTSYERANIVKSVREGLISVDRTEFPQIHSMNSNPNDRAKLIMLVIKEMFTMNTTNLEVVFTALEQQQLD